MNMRMPSFWRWSLGFPLAASVSMLVGCGGSSDTPVATTAIPKLTIAWPAQSRDALAPTYAGSASVTLTPTTGAISTWITNRPASAQAQKVNTLGPAVQKGVPAVLTITFKSGANGAGTTVATAAASVRIGEDGTLLNSVGGPLTNITFATEITGLNFTANDMRVGGSQPIVVSGNSPEGIVALPQNLVDLTISEGTEHATIFEYAIQGVSEGSSAIRATYETFSSTLSFKVKPRIPQYARHVFNPTRMAWDPVHSKFWATTSNPNTVVDFDPITGLKGTPIPVASTPEEIAVSADGTVAYVGLTSTQEIQVIDLTNRTAGSTMSVSSSTGYVITSLAVNPSDSSEIAFCMVSPDGVGTQGPIVNRGGTWVSNPPPSLGIHNLAWLTSSRLVSGRRNSDLRLYDVNVSSVSNFLTQNVNPNYSGGVTVSGSKVISDQGMIFSTTDLSLLGTITFGQETLRSVAVDSSSKAWIGSLSGQEQTIRCFDLDQLNLIDSVSVPLEQSGEQIVQMFRFGSTGIAFTTEHATYVIPNGPAL